MEPYEGLRKGDRNDWARTGLRKESCQEGAEQRKEMCLNLKPGKICEGVCNKIVENKYGARRQGVCLPLKPVQLSLYLCLIIEKEI